VHSNDPEHSAVKLQLHRVAYAQVFPEPRTQQDEVGIELQEVVNKIAQPQLWPWIDIQIRQIENLPAEGPVIMTPNHRSYLDPLSAPNTRTG